MNHEAVFLEHLPLIERVATRVCRRHRLRPEDADDFVASVRLKFIADDFAVLRTFQGRSSLPTYVTTVVQHCFIDHCNQAWGRFRPSSEARRLGPLAIELEKLMVRDGLAPIDALRTLAASHPDVGEGELRSWLDRLPARSRRTAADEEAIDELPARDADPEAALVNAAAERGGEAAQAALQSALRQLPSVDRLVLRLRNEEGLQVVDIARSLGLEPRVLYRHIARLYRDLKKQLAARGISAGVLAGRDTPPERYLPGSSGRGGPGARV